MEYILIGIIGSIVWIGIEMYRAPEMDDSGRIVKHGKKLKDIFKKK